MIITIDGPAGSGKSSAARGLARRLGFDFLDTGAMYRAVALAVIREKLEETNHAAIEALLAHIHIEMLPERVLLNGEDVTSAIRTLEVAQAASRLATIAVVRRFLAAQQRAIGQGATSLAKAAIRARWFFPTPDSSSFLMPIARSELAADCSNRNNGAT